MTSKRPSTLSLVDPADELLTTEQVADIIGGGTTKRTLENWRRRKVGPAYLAFSPTMVRYRRGKVDEYLKSIEVNTTGRVA